MTGPIRTYEYSDSSPDGWNISGTLELNGDESFSYSEGWTDYTNASLSGGAGGTWRRDGNVIVFQTERVYPPIHFPWGGQLTATVRGDALEFGLGRTLTEKTVPLKEIRVRNDAARPKTLVLEPWGVRRTLGPGERVRIVTQGEFWYGQAEKNVKYGDEEIVYRGWGGTWATIVPEPPPAAEPESVPHPPSSVPPRGNPFDLSPELVARLRGWIDKLDTEGSANRVKRLCKEHDALPLHVTPFLLWALRADGQVIVIDHGSAALSVEAEADDALARAAVAEGARLHPELAELLADGR